MKVVFLILALTMAVTMVSGKPQFSVFNRQFFPNFSFGRPSAPVRRPVARPQPTTFVSRPVSRPAPAAPSRFVPQPTRVNTPAPVVTVRQCGSTPCTSTPR